MTLAAAVSGAAKGGGGAHGCVSPVIAGNFFKV